ncbi:MAG: hypothetical protein HRT90_03685 [Candidatus Margulisbacteria bacterium]|nr:hypothetical protein [Candidatus Margulisiibacteriota bacterium]
MMIISNLRKSGGNIKSKEVKSRDSLDTLKMGSFYQQINHAYHVMIREIYNSDSAN